MILQVAEVCFPGIEYGSDLCGGRIEQQVSGRNRYAGCGTGRLDTWLITPDASVEKQAADNAIARLKDGAYYSNVAKQIANEKDLNTQIRKYLELVEKVQELYTLQSDLEC